MTQLNTPESFGAIGDGVKDDTDALKAMFKAAQGGIALFPDPSKLYRTRNLSILKGTRLIGTFRALYSEGSIGGASIITLEEGTTLDSLQLEVKKSTDLGFGISVSSNVFANSLSVIHKKQTKANAIQIKNSSNINIEKLEATNFNKGLSIENSSNVKLNDIRVTNYVRGCYFSESRNLTISSCHISGMSPDSASRAGHNGILMKKCHDVYIAGAVVENSGEHGIRITNPCSNITFSAPEIRQSGCSGIKTGESSLKEKVVGLTLIAPKIIDCHRISGAAGKNCVGMRLTSLRDSRIISPLIEKNKNEDFSAYHGIRMNDCVDVKIDTPYIHSVEHSGIVMFPTRGNVNNIFISQPTIFGCEKYGILYKSTVKDYAVRNISVLGAFIKGCKEGGIDFQLGNEGIRKTVILDGYIQRNYENSKWRKLRVIGRDETPIHSIYLKNNLSEIL